LSRAWRLVVPQEDGVERRPHLAADRPDDPDLERALHRMIHKVSADIERLAFNTAIAAMMIFVNEATKAVDRLSRSQMRRFLDVLNPFAPHITEELAARLGADGPMAYATWPAVAPVLLVADSVEMAVQVLGKKKAAIRVDADAGEPEILTAARAAVADHLAGRTIVKEIVVRGRLVNFVTR